jgi:hypothetical protein
LKAYKFLRPGRVAPFSELEWQEGTWVEATEGLQMCRSGIHACRLDQLAYWLAEELWEIELDGEVEETDLQVIAPRGKLVARVEQWNVAAQSDFALECVRRVASSAAAVLRRHDLAAEATRLADATTLEEVAARAQEAAAAAGKVVRAGRAVDLAGYAADAAGYAKQRQTAGAAFVAAHAALVEGRADVVDPFARVRKEQAEWLATRLGLA